MAKKIKFEIELRAMSFNSYQMNASVRHRYTTTKGKEWQEYIQWHIKSLLNKKVLQSFGSKRPLIVNYEFHFKSKRLCDYDNYIKPIQDSIEGLLFNNDHQFIGTDRIRRYLNQPQDKIIIEIYESDEDDGLA